MMGRFARRTVVNPVEGDGELFSLLFLGAFFFLGLLFGLLFAALGEASPELSNYLQEYFQAVCAEGGWRPALWSVVWDLVRWPLAALAFGLTTLGVVCIPGLLLVRGFLLSYSVSLFLRLFGGAGMLAALAVFGVTALCTLPVLMAVSGEAFRASLGRMGEPGSRLVVSLHQKLAVLIPSAGLLVFGTVLQWTVMPAVLDAICTRFFAL